MTARAHHGTVVYYGTGRHHSRPRTQFDSLDGLFLACLEKGAEHSVDEIVIRGVDEDGNERSLILKFCAAVTAPDQGA